MKRSLGLALAVGLSSSLFAAASAHAHFILEAPACWMSQDSAGIPEKLGPCGNEDGGTPTGTVTTFQEGDTITVTIDEVVFHPGHYRIALSTTGQGELPAEPAVTVGSTPCGSAAVESPAVYPVLADNVFEHTSPFTAPQSVQIKLPEGVTCTHCVLQVIEFMADHGLNDPGGCFYHHCADISISADGGLDDDGGAPPDGGSLASGTSGTSGASGSGGNTPASSSSTSSRVGSGSVGTGAGGERGSNGPASVSGAGGGASGASSSKGCSCSVPATEERVVANLAAIVGVALLAANRRRARG